ncbi:MAG TPA: PilZ domain-containing protein [Terracidiphilus sp.]
MLATASTSTPSFTEKARAERRPLPGLAAYHWDGAIPRLNKVRNISSTGVYLQTPDRWKPGEIVTLTLQREGPPQMAFDRHVRIRTRAVRWGNDGVALQFDSLDQSDIRLWDSPLKADVTHTEPEDILREFRLAEAIAFLRRLAPEATADFRTLLREGLSNYRVSAAVEIALKAEALVSAKPDADKMRVSPQVALRILDGGSWAEEEWVRQMWAGLLASSCSADFVDESNISLVNNLALLTPVHFRILTSTCNSIKATGYGTGWNSASLGGPTVDHIQRSTGFRDRLRVERDIDHLVDLGLLERRSKMPFYSDEEATIFPTRLGQKLHNSCEGLR